MVPSPRHRGATSKSKFRWRGLRILGAALSALGLVVTLATPALAGVGQGNGPGSANSGPALADANKPSYWQAIYGGTCTKIDGSKINSSQYTLPVGQLYTVLVIKAGSAQSTEGGEYNAVYEYPSPGHTYDAPTGTNGEVKQISHVIYCVGSGVTPATPQITQPVCLKEVATVGSFRAPESTASISYSTSDLTVTATAKPGYVLTGPSDGWSGDGYQQTFTVHYDEPDCSQQPTTPTVVVPASPTIVQPSCTATGEVSAGSFQAPDSTGEITYSVAGDVITASVSEGFALDAPQGWERVSDTEVTFTVTYSDPRPCPQPPAPTTVLPVNPHVTPPGCDGNVAVPGEVVPVETDGVDYVLTSATTVTATAEPGYVLGSATDWTGDEHVQTFTASFGPAPECGTDGPSEPITVTPVNPDVVQPGCDGPQAYPGRITPVTTTGIEYTVEGATVTAKAEPGYVLSPAAGDWKGDGKAQSYVVTFRPTPTCGTTPPPPVTPPTDTVNPSTLTIVKGVSKTDAKVGDTLAYKITTTVAEGPNNGVARQDNVKIVDPLPQGITYVTDSGVCSTMTKVDPPRKVTCSVTYNKATRTITAKADSWLQVGDSLELDFDATVDEGATMIPNVATASSDDVEGVQASITTEVTAVEGVIIEKPPVQQPGTVLPGTQAPGSVAQPATLPHTGAGGSRLPLAGLVLIGLGLAMVVGSRRRTAEQD